MLRAKARKEQTTFHAALTASQLPHWQEPTVTSNKYKTKKIRTNLQYGNEPETYVDRQKRLQHSKQVCLDDDVSDMLLELEREFWEYRSCEKRQPMTISLSDVKTRVVKAKGANTTSARISGGGR